MHKELEFIFPVQKCSFIKNQARACRVSKPGNRKPGIKKLQKGGQPPLLCCILLLSMELPEIHRFISLVQKIPTAK
jgi:hypothetical protein